MSSTGASDTVLVLPAAGLCHSRSSLSSLIGCVSPVPSVTAGFGTAAASCLFVSDVP